jgi:hypothetical protein
LIVITGVRERSSRGWGSNGEDPTDNDRKNRLYWRQASSTKQGARGRSKDDLWDEARRTGDSRQGRKWDVAYGRPDTVSRWVLAVEAAVGGFQPLLAAPTDLQSQAPPALGQLLPSTRTADLLEDGEISDSDDDDLPSFGRILARPKRVIDLSSDDDDGGEGDDDGLADDSAAVIPPKPSARGLSTEWSSNIDDQNTSSGRHGLN